MRSSDGLGTRAEPERRGVVLLGEGECLASTGPDAMLRVMIAEDHDDLRVVLRNLVEGESDLVCVGAIGSAEQIVPLARETRPDVLVLDLLLDAGSSLSVIRELRRAAPAMRIILYSGYISDTVEREAHDRGAASCVSKGVPLERLLAEIRRQGLRGADGHELTS